MKKFKKISDEMNKKIIILVGFVFILLMITAYEVSNIKLKNNGNILENNDKIIGNNQNEYLKNLIIKEKEIIKDFKDEQGNEIYKVITKLPYASSKIKDEKINKKVNLINDTFSNYYDAYIDYIKNRFFDAANDNMAYKNEEFMLELAKEALNIKNDTFDYQTLNLYEIKRNDEKVFSVQMSGTTFIGAPLPSHLVEGINIDLEDGKLIKFEDLFTVSKDVYEKRIYDIVNMKLLKMKEENIIDLYEEYEKYINVAFNQKAFLLTDNSLILIYQEYDIAAYQSGVKLIEIPFEEISDIFNNKYIK